MASQRNRPSSRRPGKFIKKCDAHFNEHEIKRERSVDSTKGLPSGELRGLTKLIKITEDVRKFAAEQGVAAEEALRRGMEQKARDSNKAGAEIHAKA